MRAYEQYPMTLFASLRDVRHAVRVGDELRRGLRALINAISHSCPKRKSCLRMSLADKNPPLAA